MMQRLQAFHEQALGEVQSSAGFLEQAQQQETVAEHTQAQACRCLADQQSRLVEAANALYACQASLPADDFCTGGCDAQEQEQAEAERACEYALQDLARAEQGLADAVVQRIAMQARLEQRRQVFALHECATEAVRRGRAVRR